MPDARIATAADYADAMMTARRAKHWLFLLLLVMLLIQLACFFVGKYTNVIVSESTTTATTRGIAIHDTTRLQQLLRYVTVGIDFLGIVLAILQSTVLLLIVNIMLV